MSKREDRIREAASLHAKIGQLQRYCELMVELGEVTFTLVVEWRFIDSKKQKQNNYNGHSQETLKYN